MDLIICFIDDSPFEHDLVRQEIAPSTPGLKFIQAYTFEEAKEKLAEKIPVLFLLDLWGQDMTVKKPSLMPKRELEKKIFRMKTLETVYEDLENFQGDRTNEYLKRLFTIVDGWRNIFEEVCDRIGQNRKYGLSNLQQVRKWYPGIPAVFYTRKSLISDAVAMFEADADGLFIKPTGIDDAETRFSTRQYAPKLIEALALIVDRHVDKPDSLEKAYNSEFIGEKNEMACLLKTWRTFRKRSKTSLDPS
jgi:DNA-binding NarL/FixJ family response regulator